MNCPKTMADNIAASSALAAARYARWYEKLRNDPKRWAERMAKQQSRRSADEIRQNERRQERERWAQLPKGHPRKTRKVKRTAQAKIAKRQRNKERLPDSLVANGFLHMKVGECPKELIQLKREQIRLNRKLGTRMKTL